MRHLATAFLTGLAPIAVAGTLHAQDAPMAGHDMGGRAETLELPAACISGAPAVEGMGDMSMGDMGDMEGHRAMMMEGMMQTHMPMMQGMMNEDPDLAFACGMIPHHVGAIRMAEAQLEYGEDETIRALAEQIIAAQEREIEELTTWIEGRAGSEDPAGTATPDGDHDDH